MTSLEIPALTDAHLHLRQGRQLAEVAPFTDRCCAYALVMPNTEPPIVDVQSFERYYSEVRDVLYRTKILSTFKLTTATTPEMVRELKRAGAVAAKLYPCGVTTNSEDGIPEAFLRNPREHQGFLDVLNTLEEEDLVLCLHGEMPGSFCLHREDDFLDFVDLLVDNYPKLRIVLEHITTAESVALVESYECDNVAATITLHHLLITLDDLVGDKLNVHNFCKPVAKAPYDREVLWNAVSSGHKQFFLGSDSAPHWIDRKECAHGCAGCFTAPVLPELLAEAFEQRMVLHRLKDFSSTFGNAFYRLPPTEQTLKLVKEDWTVPGIVAARYVPFHAKKKISWRLDAGTVS